MAPPKSFGPTPGKFHRRPPPVACSSSPRSRGGLMRTHSPISLPFLLLVLLPTVQAQAPTSGTLVRITSPQVPQGRAVGVFERFNGDTVVVAGLPISRASITRLEVSAGRKSHWLAGMGIGFVVGGGLGALSCVIACPEDTGSDAIKGIETVALGGLGALVGLLAGGIVGAFRISDRWREVSLSTLRIAPTLRSDGTFGVSIGLRF